MFETPDRGTRHLKRKRPFNLHRPFERNIRGEDTFSGGEQQMLVVEQNVRLALALSDYAYVLADGCVVLDGPAHEVDRMPEVRAAYLGL